MDQKNCYWHDGKGKVTCKDCAPNVVTGEKLQCRWCKKQSCKQIIRDKAPNHVDGLCRACYGRVRDADWVGVAGCWGCGAGSEELHMAKDGSFGYCYTCYHHADRKRHEKDPNANGGELRAKANETSVSN